MIHPIYVNVNNVKMQTQVEGQFRKINLELKWNSKQHSIMK